jgi:hypothetical protein
VNRRDCSGAELPTRFAAGQNYGRNDADLTIPRIGGDRLYKGRSAVLMKKIGRGTVYFMSANAGLSGRGGGGGLLRKHALTELDLRAYRKTTWH